MQDIEDMIANNIGLLRAQLKRLALRGDCDAESIGYEALYTAASTFDESKGFKFSTYATCVIYNALGSYIRFLKRKKQLDVMSYNNIAFSEDGINHEFVELLESPSSVEHAFMQSELCNALHAAYNYSYNRLTNPKHAAIAKLWYECDGEISNKEIADKVGVSQPYVNQVINTFKFSLRKKLEVYHN